MNFRCTGVVIVVVVRFRTLLCISVPPHVLACGSVLYAAEETKEESVREQLERAFGDFDCSVEMAGSVVRTMRTFYQTMLPVAALEPAPSRYSCLTEQELETKGAPVPKKDTEMGNSAETPIQL